MFFFIIVLFGLSQLFRRKTTESAEQKANDPKAKPMPPIHKPFFEEWFEQEKAETQMETTDAEFPFEDVKREFEAEYQPEPEFSSDDSQVEELQMLSQVDEAPFRRKERTDRQPEDKGISLQTFQKPTRGHLMQGVIWAEVLGPPRSKKPYHYNRYR